MKTLPYVYPIFRRELQSYFNSPVAYVVIVFFLAVVGWFFSSSLFLMNIASLATVFEVIPWIFIGFIPAITMRLLAEEKKAGTIELLVTKPIRDVEIILGKFFAAWALLGATLLPTLIYLVAVSSIGEIDPGPVFAGYLGLFLMGGVYVSIGLFASSLTENQIVAFIVTLIAVLALFLIDKMLIFLPDTLSTTLEFLSVDYHFSSIARGVVDSRDILYFFSVIGFSLLLATVSLERRKW
ncbi:MAG: ABC transporter permease [Ignavibacteria bacterium]|nr:ABC transporter permease [Ignavibacteria bacterium]